MKKLPLLPFSVLLFLAFFTAAAAFAQETYKAGDKVVIQNWQNSKWYDGEYVSGSDDNHNAKFTHLGSTTTLTGLYNSEIMPPAEANAKGIVRENATSTSTSTGGTSTAQPPKVKRTVGTGTAPTTPAASSVNLTNLETGIVAEVNRMRANPKAYADELAQLSFINAGTGQIALFAGNDRMWTCSTSDPDCMNQYLDKLQAAVDALYGLPTADYPVTQTPLSQLTRKTELDKGSEMLAADLGAINGPLHKDSKGRGPFCRAKTANYSQRIGECLNSGFISARGFVLSFMTSPGHRKILTEAHYDHIGVDTYYHTNGGYIRDVIMNGDKDVNMMADPCGQGY